MQAIIKVLPHVVFEWHTLIKYEKCWQVEAVKWQISKAMLKTMWFLNSSVYAFTVWGWFRIFGGSLGPALKEEKEMCLIAKTNKKLMGLYTVKKKKFHGLFSQHFFFCS